MIINENHSRYFKLDTTGIEKYDHLLNNLEHDQIDKNWTYRIAWMRPNDYITRCARDIFNVDYDKLFDTRHDNKIYKYQLMMQDGTQFDMPVLNYATRNQEGLHRSIASMRNSEEDLIPVMIVYNKKPVR